MKENWQLHDDAIITAEEMRAERLRLEELKRQRDIHLSVTERDARVAQLLKDLEADESRVSRNELVVTMLLIGILIGLFIALLLIGVR